MLHVTLLFFIQMTKKIKKLEKETAMYRSRWESSNKALLEMAEEVRFPGGSIPAATRRDRHCSVLCPSLVQKSVRDRDFEALQGKVQRLEKLRRALKVERNELNKKVRSLSSAPDETPASGTDSPSPPPTDSPPDPSGPPVPDSASCSQPCHCDQQLDTETLLEGAAGPPVSTQE